MDNLLTPPSIASLSASLTPTARRLFEQACVEAERLGLELWAIGGTVRDAAIGRASVDIDLTVNRDVDRLATAIAAALGAELTSEARFGTASVRLDDERLDLATLRSEHYPASGALPEVTLGGPIERDLQRRDFNVNAIGLALTGPRQGELLDPFGGLSDLGRRRFAVLHDRSFEDDATRIWRAARLSAQRDLHPTTETHRLLIEGARSLAAISGDRLWSEFELIAERGRAGRTLGLLEDWGALEAVSPAWALSSDARRALRHRWRPLAAAQLAAVLLGRANAAAATEALRRLNAPTDAVQTVEDTRRLLAATDSEPDNLERLSATGEAARRAGRWLDPRQVALQRELRRWERTRPHLDATALLALGIAEGPDVGALLRCLRRGRYLGTLSTRAEARALVRRHLERRKDAG